MLFVAVCLVAVNMRMTITGVGPLLEQIAADQSVSPAVLGGLASVPLLTWALVSPLAHGLSMRIGLSRAVTWSLIALMVGTVWRSLPGGPPNLWLGTALIGAALAIGNVLLPAVIRRDFSTRVPLVMGVYTALLGGLGAVSAGLVVPIARIDTGAGELGWRVALLTTGALIPIALVVWIAATRTPGGRPVPAPDSVAAPAGLPPRSGRGIWRDPVAWWVAAYMGLQAALFYMISTWLAPIATTAGRSAVEAGVEVMLYQVVAIGGSLLVPLLYRGNLKKWVPALIPAVIAGAFAGFVFTPAAPLPWILVGGAASGASLSLSLLFMATKAPDHSSASALSGMAQSVGYLIAAAGPIAFGAAHEATGDWLAPLILLLAVGAAQLIAGIVLGRDRLVFERA
ncbi:MFS transporter [Leucobacter luti]|nr:MFS transporter [Leucobacter luti]MBL3699187.1 MFS transporter [Leucobacter luti]